MVGVAPANAPEASVTDALEQDLHAQQQTLSRTAHRPGLPQQQVGQRPHRRLDDLLQSLFAFNLAPTSLPKQPLSSIGTSRPSPAQIQFLCPSASWAKPLNSPPKSVRLVPSKPNAPPASLVAVSPFIQTSRCLRSYVNAKPLLKDGHNCVKELQLNTA